MQWADLKGTCAPRGILRGEADQGLGIAGISWAEDCWAEGIPTRARLPGCRPSRPDGNLSFRALR